MKTPTSLLFGTAFVFALATAERATLSPPAISWEPASPVEGSLVRIAVRPDTADDGSDPLVAIGGELAGEALHFERDGSGAFHALGGVPIDARGTLALSLSVRRASGSVEALEVELPVSRGDYAMERLRVAPEFGSEPDAALAARIASEQARALAVSRAAHATPRLWRESFIRPRGDRVTSGFGHGREYNGAVQSRHMGVDFAGAVGEPVYATNRGVVALVADFYLAGTAVYLDHGAGLVTAYFHLSRAEVAQGDTVARGQLIGRVGATGRVTGPHLHWTVRYGEITVDPMSLLGIEAFPERPE